MQCPICGFYNMRGTERCVRCRTRLFFAQPPAPAELVPPRAGWTRHFRFITYRFNRIFGPSLRQLAQQWDSFYTVNKRLLESIPLLGDLLPERGIPARSYTAMLLSCLPGAGHLCCGGRWRRGMAALGLWLLLALAAIAAEVPMSLRGGLIGLAIFCHMAVAIDAAEIRQRVPAMIPRIRFATVTAILFFSLYAIPYLHSDYRILSIPDAVADLGVQANDLLLAKQLSPKDTSLRAGDLVTFSSHGATTSYTDDRGTVRRYNYGGGTNIPGQILAFPGQEVEVDAEGIKVDGRLAFSAAWLKQHFPTRRFPAGKRQVKQGEVAVVFFELQGNGIPVVDWQTFFLVGREQIEYRALAVYQPWSRRHWLKPPAPGTEPNRPGPSLPAARESGN